MRLIPSSPGLLNTIISIAALHRAQRANTLHISSQINSDTGNKTDLQSQITTPQPSKPFYDALLHKQEALCHIRNEFQNPNVANHDGAIAAVLMFIWLELMDSGRDSWRYHLTALRNIMQKSLFPVLENAKSFMSTFSSSCEYFEMTYAIFDIIGSTFVKPMQPSHAYQPLFTKMSTIDILQLAESQTWIGCPAELLYIISLAKTVPQTAEQGKSLKTHLTSHLTSFSPRRWAIAGPDIARLMPRYHFACAYRDAVSIYISQVTFGWVGCEWEVDSSDGGLEVDLDATIMHLKEISPHDAFYKALVWPAFVIGADAKLEKQRVAIREVFGRLWIVWRAGNVSNALRVLREIWMRGDEELWSKPWIGFLYEWGADWMFV
ncbi:fungal-specific transcription factor domain-containing protein [Penicillium antarcticum]|uniref:fungal-specific transcription factor domain-containing protein n=1 Tax=Penicillium antarcticum TaxID=416450 RepID=UPI00238D4CF0|nr:fungal-specific transcription factor domain-containing protein [Penicillium antarcticum]KAJ5312092.1 fungal-specific transcription factor domain-containing protein [Penicillium antarcticum]